MYSLIGNIKLPHSLHQCCIHPSVKTRCWGEGAHSGGGEGDIVSLDVFLSLENVTDFYFPQWHAWILGCSCWGADRLLFSIWGPHCLVQRVGIVACFTEAWTNSANVGVSSSASVLSSLVGVWSGPVALCTLNVPSSLWIPFGAIAILHRAWTALLDQVCLFSIAPYLLSILASAETYK